MKPDISQKAWIKDCLRKNLKYRETYAEFYDHVLAALEALPSDFDIHDSVKKIIHEDFGGMAGMRDIEAKYQKSTFREMQFKYLDAVMECLKFPLILFLLPYSIIICFVVRQNWYNFFTFLILMVIIRLISGLMKFARYIRSGFVFADTKPSAKDSFFKWMDYVPGVILLAVLCGNDLFRSAPPALLKNSVFNAIFLIVSGWHAIAFYKVYRHDIKTSFTVN